ncbi:unnamed protein product [Paramecium sonneborni]|uniref:Uncharacterized protein n=1 Tax=Paramecium sonneborni TaxID=65129 RepID=A0A8S1M4I1_9CILI|nr:unnamed protein product [Paramecium sonneborni]
MIDQKHQLKHFQKLAKSNLQYSLIQIIYLFLQRKEDLIKILKIKGKAYLIITYIDLKKLYIQSHKDIPLVQIASQIQIKSPYDFKNFQKQSLIIDKVITTQIQIDKKQLLYEIIIIRNNSLKSIKKKRY